MANTAPNQSPDRSIDHEDAPRRAVLTAEPQIRRGKHRAPSRWALHRPAHEDPQRGIISLLVPAWKSKRDEGLFRQAGPGTHRATVTLDDSSGPRWTLPTSGVDLEISLEGDDVVIVDRTPQPAPEETPVEPTATTQVENPTSLVDRSTVLPPSPVEESSSLASLFGFGERQVDFDAEWTTETEEQETAWDSLPSLSDVAVDGEEYRTTGNAIQRLWDATEHHPIVIDDLDVGTEQAPTRLLDNRQFRRTALIGLVVGMVLIGWAVREVGTQPERAAIARETRYANAATDLDQVITPIEASLAVLTTPEMGAADFSPLTGDLDALDGVARSTSAIATEPLPRAPIVGSSLPIDELILPKRLLEQASLQALAIEQRVGDAVNYRLTFAAAFDFPDLPGRATLEEIGTIGADLSVAIAATEQVLAQLPDDSLFAAHRQQAHDLLDTLENVQVDYFSALRNGQATQADQIGGAMLRSIDRIHDGVDGPLVATEKWAQGQIDQLREVLDEVGQLVAAS